MSTANKILMGASGAGGPVGPSDDEFNRVSFLSHFDGSNDGVNNQFTDGSASNHTITANGNVTQGSFGPFARPDGEWGVSFDNSGDRLSIPSSSDFGFGTGDYTISFMVFLTAINDYDTILAVGSGNNGLGLFIEDGVNLAFGRAGTAIDVTFSNVFTGLGQWNSIVFKRASGVVTVYVNGSSVGTNNTSSSQFDYQAADISIGTETNGSTNPFGGIISNFRIVKGTALTPSSGFPTSKLTAVTNTVLLTCQSNRFVDNSASGHTITPAGNAAVTAFGPFLTSSVYDPAVNGASAYLPASDYLSFAASSDFDVGTGDFTIECSLYYAEAVPSGINYDYIWAVGANATTGIGLYVQGGIVKIWNGSNVASGSTTVNQGEWTTLSVVRSGSTLSVYQNGVRETTATVSSDITTAGNGGSIGGWINVDSNIPIAYITDFRFVNGTALRSGASYTLPTAPLTAVTNTKLLLNMADGQAIDSAAQNNLTLYGNANTSTDQAKFGNTSLHLDGTGDYFEVPNPTSLAFGTGNFTLECWVYMAVDNTNKAIVETRASDLSANGFVFAIDASGGRKLMVYSDAKLFTTSNAISLNTWTHIAISRSGTTLKCFINGTEGASVTNSQDYTNALVRVGRGIYASSDFNGYIDDLRFSNMARYTSNFTAPTEPFADKGQ